MTPSVGRVWFFACALVASAWLPGCGGDSPPVGDQGVPPSDSDTVPTDGDVPLRCEYPDGLAADTIAALEAKEGSAAPVETILADTLASLRGESDRFTADVVQLLGLEADGSVGTGSLTSITWDPTHDAAHLAATIGVNTELIFANVNDDGPLDHSPALAVLGRHRGETPYLVFGGNPFRNDTDAEMKTLLRNAIAWAAGRVGTTAEPLDIVLAHLDQSFFFPDEVRTRAFLDAELPGTVRYNDADACDDAALAGCWEGADLLIVSQAANDATDPDDVAAQVEAALAAGVGVLYIQLDGDLDPIGRAIFDALQVRYVRDNYWPDVRVEGVNPTSRADTTPAAAEALRETFSHLVARDFTFTLAEIRDDPGANEAFVSEFRDGAQQARALLADIDRAHRSLLEGCDSLALQLVVLSADALRQGIVYPMPSDTTDTNAFLRAYFADHAVYNHREVGAAQPDRGTFDPMDLSAITPVTRDLTLLSRRRFRSAGVYALPGRTVRITRLDNAAVETAVFVNSLRSGATDEFSQYRRPKYLQSTRIPIAEGETVLLNSPYGGPLQIEFDANDETVRFRVEGVGEHPHWRSSADDATFAARLASRTYNWVEVATDGFELHSRLDKFDGTLADPRWNTPATLAAAIERYTYDATHVMAGFRGDGVEEHAEVHGWADNAGLPVATIDIVKHGNMDQPTCGSGCSGNPYDASWSFSPIGHGDLHELGHSLQRDRLQLTHGGTERYPNHAVTNWTPFYGAARYYDDHGGEPVRWGVDHAPLYAALQAAYTAGDRPGAFSSEMDTFLAGRISNLGDAYSFYLQAMAAARYADVLDNGYHIVPRVHILERAFLAARADDVTWMASRDAIGMGAITHAQAESLSDNDFMAIAMSFATGLDYRDFFAMWGVAISAEADAQIAAYASPAVPRAFFALDENSHKEGALTTRLAAYTRLPIDGTTVWPLN